MDRRYIRGAVRGRLQKSFLGRILFDHYPKRTRFLDGSEHRVPYGTHLLFELWLKDYPVLAAESKAAFDAYRGGDFIDIGAYNGWYSLLLSPKAAKSSTFLSIEPDRNAFPLLLRSLEVVKRLYPHIWLAVETKPAGDGGAFDVSYPSGDQGHPSFAPSASGASGLRTLTVDALVNAHGLKPQFVKIDVEGAEYGVLQGMRETLRTHRPVLMLETHPDWLPAPVSMADVTGFLGQCGYTFRPMDESHWLCHPAAP